MEPGFINEQWGKMEITESILITSIPLRKSKIEISNCEENSERKNKSFITKFRPNRIKSRLNFTIDHRKRYN